MKELRNKLVKELNTIQKLVEKKDTQWLEKIAMSFDKNKQY